MATKIKTGEMESAFLAGTSSQNSVCKVTTCQSSVGDNASFSSFSGNSRPRETPPAWAGKALTRAGPPRCSAWNTTGYAISSLCLKIRNMGWVLEWALEWEVSERSERLAREKKSEPRKWVAAESPYFAATSPRPRRSRLVRVSLRATGRGWCFRTPKASSH